MKVCSKCGIEKDEGEFNKRKKSKDGLNYWCKSCKKEWRKNNKEYDKEYSKEYRENNKEYFNLYRKKWYKENKEYYNEYNKKEYLIKYRKTYHSDSVIFINGEYLNINTATDELKEFIQGLIELRKKNKFIKELKNG